MKHSGQPWSNWIGTVDYRAGRVFETDREDRLVEHVAETARAGAQLKAVGTGHSWSPITQSGDSAIFLGPLSGITKTDRAQRLVSAYAGMTLKDFNAALARIGLALPNLGSINQQSLGGMVSTATHGTGLRFSTLSGLLRHIRLVDGLGNIHDITEESNPRWFRAACCGVGALGVITQVTLQCEDAFRLHCVEELMKVDEVLERLDELVAENQHFKFWWVPGTRWALTFRQNRTEEPKRNAGWGHRWWHRMFMRNSALETGLSLASRVPAALGMVQRMITMGTPKRREYVDASHEVFNFPVNVKHWESEFALPIEAARAGFEALRELIDREGFRVGFITECRFVGRDAPWLSPAHGRETAYIGAFQYHGMPYKDYFRVFSRSMHAFDGRPHWGKMHDLSGREIAAGYAHWDDFRQVRAELDPKGVFLNRYLKDVFDV